MRTIPFVSSLDPSFASPEIPKGAISQARGVQVFKYYSEWLKAQGRECLREVEIQFSERQWQAHLYQKRFGSQWISQEGEAVEVLHFGKWNHEEGPDFLNALVKVGGNPPIRGDLELDRNVRDWERHRHALKSTYRNVLVHFFFEKPAEYTVFTRNLEGRKIHQIHLDLDQLKSPTLQNTRSIFSGVDLLEIEKLLETAARFRMLHKHETFRQKIALLGFAEALFQGIATVLGYRPNGIPFSLLARRVGIDLAASPSGEALLFGMAGFLRGEEFMNATPEGKKYLRSLWDLWWSSRGAFPQLSPQIWRRTSVRPFNYPERRLGALALIAKQFSIIQELVREGKEKAFLDFMKSLHHPFWQTHCSFFSKSHPECLLLGEERALDLLVNVFYPVQDVETPVVWNSFRAICLPQIPKKILEAVSIFIGEERLPQARLREAVVQQGLLQIISHFARFDFFSLS